MVGPTENIMSKGNYWITKRCLLSQTRCMKKAQILPATHKKGTREQGHMCCFNEALQKVTVFNDSTERLFVYAVAQQRKNLSLMWEETQIKWTKFILTWWRNQCQLYLFLSCCLITRMAISWGSVTLTGGLEEPASLSISVRAVLPPLPLLHSWADMNQAGLLPVNSLYRLLAVSTGTGLTEMAFCILLFLIDLLCSNCLSPITWKKRNLTHTLVNKHTDTDAREKWIGGEGSNILLLFLFLTGCIAAQRCALQLIIMTMGKQVESTSYLTAC